MIGDGHFQAFVLWCQTSPVTGTYGMSIGFDGEWELSGRELLLVRRNSIDLDISLHAERESFFAG